MDGGIDRRFFVGRLLITYLSVVVVFLLFVLSATDLDYLINANKSIDVFGVGFTVPISLGVAAGSWTVTVAQYALIVSALTLQRRGEGAFQRTLILGVSVVTLLVQLLVLSQFLRGQFSAELQVTRLAILATALGPLTLLFAKWRSDALRTRVSVTCAALTGFVGLVYAYGIARTPTEMSRYDIHSSPVANRWFLADVSHSLFYGKFGPNGRLSLFSGTLDISSFSNAEIGEALNLIDRDLSGRNLSGLRAKGRELKDVRFMNANLAGAQFLFAKLSDSHFGGANLAVAEFLAAQAVATTFNSANLLGASFAGANLTLADFDFARLPLSSFDQVKLILTKFSHADLRGSSFTSSDVAGALFDKADLMGASFARVDFSGVNFNGAKVWRAWPRSATDVVAGRAAPWPRSAFIERLDMGMPNFMASETLRAGADSLIADKLGLERLLFAFETSEGPRPLRIALLVSDLEDRLRERDVVDDHFREQGEQIERQRFAEAARIWSSGSADKRAYLEALAPLIEGRACSGQELQSTSAAIRLVSRLFDIPRIFPFKDMSYADDRNLVRTQSDLLVFSGKWYAERLERAISAQCLGTKLTPEMIDLAQRQIASHREAVASAGGILENFDRNKQLDEALRKRERDEIKAFEDAVKRCDPVVIHELEKSGAKIEGC